MMLWDLGGDLKGEGRFPIATHNTANPTLSAACRPLPLKNSNSTHLTFLKKILTMGEVILTPLRAVRWSPHFTVPHFMVASTAQTLKLLDSRIFGSEHNPVVWKRGKSHNDLIRDIR